MPTSRATRSAARAPSPVSSTGVSPSAFSSRIASALVGLTVSRTASVARALAVPGDGDRAVARPTSTAMARRRRRRRRRPAGCGTRRPPGARRPRPRAAEAIACATGCSDAASRAPAKRRISARLAPFSGATSASSIRPSVIVPVLSSTIVPTRRVCSRTSGPRIRIPSCAPRPVPTISAVGVARPSAHGHAMIRTATAAVNALAADAPSASQPASVSERDRDHDRHEDRRDAVGEPLHRRLAGLRGLDEARDLRERGVGADLRRAHDEPPVRCSRSRRRPRCRRATSTGTDSPVSSDWSTADSPSTTTPSVAIFSPGRTTNRSPTRSSRPARAPRRRRAARARPSRRARAACGSRPPSGASRAPRDSGRAGSASSRRRRPRSTCRCRCPATSTTVDQSHAAERAERDQRVHRRGAVARARQRGAVEADAAVEDDRRRERERDPLPAGELERRHHREQRDRHRQDDREAEAARAATATGSS